MAVVHDTLLSRLNDKAEDAIAVVMQRLHVDDRVGRLLEQGGFRWVVVANTSAAPAMSCTPSESLLPFSMDQVRDAPGGTGDPLPGAESVSWDTDMSARELWNYSACVVLLAPDGTAFVLDAVRERLEYQRSEARW